MKKSKRYIKKQNNKPLINKKVLAKVIRESNICKYAIKELKLAGYGNGEGGYLNPYYRSAYNVSKRRK